jgi:hypothetical protein
MGMGRRVCVSKQRHSRQGVRRKATCSICKGRAAGSRSSPAAGRQGDVREPERTACGEVAVGAGHGAMAFFDQRSS